LDEPEVDHGAAVFASFCAELKRGERWGGSVANRRVGVVVGGGGERGSSSGASLWKEILRGALTPTMFARRIRSSDEFSILLDWERLDVTDGMAVSPSYYLGQRQVLGITGSETVAFVNAALFFGEGVEPSIVQFTLVKVRGVWLIDAAVVSKKEWFMDGDVVGDGGYDGHEVEEDEEFDGGDV